jgi:hypothetical protein
MELVWEKSREPVSVELKIFPGTSRVNQPARSLSDGPDAIPGAASESGTAVHKLCDD